MLLRKKITLCLFLFFAKTSFSDEINEEIFDTTTLIGVDAWHLRPSTWDGNANRNLFLANSQSAWDYKSVSPWLKSIINAKFSDDLTFQFKFRADQSLGLHVDDLHIDWSFWPTTGIRAGVVDFKVNWCKTYDVDSPWIRENDPFCTSPSTFTANNAGPGIQLYNNSRWGDYKLQSIIGIYRPTLFKYNPQEFGNYILPEDQHEVTKNNKVGIAFSATNTETGTTYRLGYLTSDQFAVQKSNSYFQKQNIDFIFYGIEFLMTESSSIEIHKVKSSWDYKYYSPSLDNGYVTYPVELRAHDIAHRQAIALELKNQMDAKNIVAYAFSRYSYTDDQVANYTYVQHITPVVSYVTPWDFLSRSHSVSWRHDWGNWFSSIQYTRAFMNQNKGLPDRSDGHALGLRIGVVYD
jgi:hypothetical protein